MLEAIFQGDTFMRLLDGDPLHRIGVVAAVLSIYAFVPYARDVVACRTRPQRASWLIWAVLSCIALGSNIAEGASASLWFAVIQCAGTVAILLLAISRGAGQFMVAGDGYILTAAAVGLALWAATDNAAYALGVTITISLLGGYATIRKAFLDPASETLSTWLICCAAACLAIASVGQFDWVLLAYPLYLATLYGAVVVAIVLGRARRTQFTMATKPM